MRLFVKNCKKWIAACLFFVLLVVFLVLVFSKKICPNELLAKGYDVKGVDVSHYQGTIEMEKLEQQDIQFIFIKATEGSRTVDEAFDRNWAAATRTDLFAGAYHFFSFDSPGKGQAKHYIATVGDLSGKLIPIVDVEYYGNKEKNPPDRNRVFSELTAFLKALEEEYGVKPMIYTTYKVYWRYIREDFSEYPLWIRNVYYKPGMDLGRAWDFWQYSDTAELKGYDGQEKYIDCNVFSGSVDRLQDYLVAMDYGLERNGNKWEQKNN